MISIENQYYIRFILLLIKGGTEILTKIIQRGLDKERITVHDLLKQNKDAICQSDQISKNRKQCELLYPPSPQVADISQWDISLLSFIGLNYLKNTIKTTECKAIQRLKDIRNDISHKHDASIDGTTYIGMWSELIMILTTLIQGMSDEDKDHFNELITYASSAHLDMNVALEELKLRTEDICETVKKRIEDLEQVMKSSHTELTHAITSYHKDVLEMKQSMALEMKQCMANFKKEIEEIMTARDNKGEISRVINTMFGAVRVSADEVCTIATAENLLLSASKSSVEKAAPPEHLQAVKEKVDNFIEDLEQRGNKVNCVEKGSILFEFTSPTLNAMIDLIDYFCSPLVQDRMNAIAKCLETLIGKEIFLFAYIPQQQMDDILKKLKNMEESSELKIMMTCTGAQGLLHVWDVFEEGAASNSLNDLSKTLSEVIGKPVRLETSIDIDQMKRAIEATKHQLSLSNAVGILKKRCQNSGCGLECSEDTCPYCGSHTTIVLDGVEARAEDYRKVLADKLESVRLEEELKHKDEPIEVSDGSSESDSDISTTDDQDYTTPPDQGSSAIKKEIVYPPFKKKQKRKKNKTKKKRKRSHEAKRARLDVDANDGADGYDCKDKKEHDNKQITHSDLPAEKKIFGEGLTWQKESAKQLPEKNITSTTIQLESKPTTVQMETRNTESMQIPVSTRDKDYDVDTEFKRQTRSMTKTDQSRQAVQNAQSGCRPNTSQTQSDQQFIHVVFHALLSPEVKFDESVDYVVVRIGHPHIGGWNCFDHIMEFKRRYDRGFVEMEYNLNVPKDLMSGSKRIEYKYYVIRNTKTRTGKPRKHLWDHYFVNGHAGPAINRHLSIPDAHKNTVIWHQFDGVINRNMKQKTGILNWLFGDYKARSTKLREDAELTLQIFGHQIMSNIGKNDVSPAFVFDAVAKIGQLLHGIKRMCFADGNYFYQTEKQFMERVEKHIVEPLITQFDQILTISSEDSTKHFQSKMAIQILLLSVLNDSDYNVVNTNRETLYHKLCQAFRTKPDSNESRCKEFDFILRHFPERREYLTSALCKLVSNVVKTGKDPVWLYVMPLIHFLSGACSPFESVSNNTSHTAKVPAWWGTDLIGEKTTSSFKQHKDVPWVISIEDVLKTIMPQFEADYLLPRTFMACLSLHEVHEVVSNKIIPSEVCIATLNYYLVQTRNTSNQQKDPSHEENIVCRCIKVLAARLQEESKEFNQRYSATKWNVATQISKDLADEALHASSNRNEIASLCVLVYLLCTSLHQKILAAGCQQFLENDQNINNVLTKAIFWLKQHFSKMNHTLTNFLRVWNAFTFEHAELSTKVKTMWNRKITETLTKELNTYIRWQDSNTEEFVIFYCETEDTFNRCFENCLYETACQAIDKAYAIEARNINDRGRLKLGDLLSKMFRREWSKLMKNVTDFSTTEFLREIFKWSPLQRFLSIFFTEHNVILLDDDCKTNITRIVSVIDFRVEQLLKGTLTVGDLKVFCEDSAKFVDIADQLQKKDSGITRVFLTQVLEIRERELKEFQNMTEMVHSLMFLCKKLPNVDLGNIDEVIEKVGNIDSHKLSEFVQIQEFGKERTGEQESKYEIPYEVQELLPMMFRCYKSSVFLKIWDMECVKEYENVTSLDDIPHIWEPVFDLWISHKKQLTTGDILFEDFEKLIGAMCGEDYERMTAELQIMEIPEDIAKTRIAQVTKYRQLETCRAGARKLLSFRRSFGLKGNFEDIQVIADDDQSKLKMRHFDNSFMETCKLLSDFTSERTDCIETFLRCQPLVQWLKESMHTSGLKELQVFVDLASMSIGDDPYNIGKVQALNAAVTGYAPLIFDLQPEFGYKELLELCKVVFRELIANPKLPKQLEDTNSQIEWLEHIKQAHGSVEVTSMMQTEAINSDGTYIVGRHVLEDSKGPYKSQIDSECMNISDTIQLTVPELKGKRPARSYSFSQLQDLQSRLMLVAGKAQEGRECIDRFIMVFDSITRLSSVYIKLYRSGCVLFQDWSARFICDPDPKRPVCASLHFGQGEHDPQLKGRRSWHEDLTEIIPAIANFMEDCLEQWLDHIEEKRKKFFHLNHFTVDQLVILQRELVKVGTQTKPSHLIYPLLSAVKEHCNEDDLSCAMKDAKERLTEDAYMETEDLSETELNADSNIETDDDLKKKQAFIKQLVDAGQREDVARRAVEYVDLDNMTDGILWCLEHEHDEIEDDYKEVQQDVAMSFEPNRKPFSGWSHSESSLHELIRANVSALGQHCEVGVKPLIDDMNTLWKEFLTSIISANVKDYLSLEHLGIILQQLAARGKGDIQRLLPPGLREDCPNLVVCPAADVLPTTLSLYMTDTEQPLPQSDEVLVCTASTSKDEVEIFLRRAFFEKSQKIYCLVNADLLDYDVCDISQKVLEEFQKDLKIIGAKYRLIIVCSAENETRSSMVSFLDKFRRQLPIVSVDKVLAYTTGRLQVKSEDGCMSAGSVDVQGSTVRVIKSSRSGVGKTLYKLRRERAVKALNKANINTESVTIPLQEKSVDLHYVMAKLLKHSLKPTEVAARIFHFDISHEVQTDVDYLLFNLLILGCLVDKTGYVWRRSQSDLYLIETMPIFVMTNVEGGSESRPLHSIFTILPTMTCRSPRECLAIYNRQAVQEYEEFDQLFDEEEFRSDKFQRPFQYLLRLNENRRLDDVQPNHPEGSTKQCLEVFFRYCGIDDPSWSELHNFVWFVNTQLIDYVNNNFVSAAAAEDLPGFSNFVLIFLIQMSKDFSTRSLRISEQTPGLHAVSFDRMETDEEDLNEDEDVVKLYQMRRTWESSPHPYLFFNCDREAFTFLGFNINPQTLDLVDQQTEKVLVPKIMEKNLYEALIRNKVPLNEDFRKLDRLKQIAKLCDVMGIKDVHDPDDTYELTPDNVKKMMAIYMRFRCDIPVVIMGETGCGKTRLIKFMCALQIPKTAKDPNMILMKVHGGTTNQDIIKRVRKAESIAKKNIRTFGDKIYTVLFFDEANTTESIGLIKEIMCDKRIEGEKLKLVKNLKIVAACNPYRKHSEELIKRLEQAGLGYHVDAKDTTDKLGKVPMRRLVYRVQPLPQSLLPLVWDFGQLNTNIEGLYIRQMVKQYERRGKLPAILGMDIVISGILTVSQDFMRRQKDECSFVSLRDVDRVLTVMCWFYKQSKTDRILYNLIDKKMYKNDADSEDGNIERIDDLTRSLILAVGVCYHACLKRRSKYRKEIAKHFKTPCDLRGGAQRIFDEIDCCQDVFLDNVDLEENISRNLALKENVFMMVVCIELRIPLFLIGKPGSSKSLAKTIVLDAMRGNGSKKSLFKQMKQVKMTSYQCSPLSTPEGVVAIFKEGAGFQKDNMETFVSVVVLDEVGLAEDSPRMPLKTLHPLLEDGCEGDEEPQDYMKVAFIGISNWALDPAKMNRGIVVQRDVPDLEELVITARGICQTDKDLARLIEPMLQPMAEAYLELFAIASKRMREFFGLRDFYSLVKMLCGFIKKTKQIPTWYQLVHAIKRNFGGLDQVDPVDFFKKHLTKVIYFEDHPRRSDPDCSAQGLIRECLSDTNNSDSESRYLLLLTENFGALSIIQQLIFEQSDQIKPIVIFGSSFRRDQEYTQVCRNINKIKICMETGNTVVLLNLENLYESLYDALNQYYSKFGDVRYVDLGLGTHRVKCPVHENFRLIVVAEKETVYKKFPIPLINRLEKHFLTTNTILSDRQRELVEKLDQWAQDFAGQRESRTWVAYRTDEDTVTKVGDVFTGYHEDTCSAIVIHVWEQYAAHQNDVDDSTFEVIFHDAKLLLLWCATPDALMRLKDCKLPLEEQKALLEHYCSEQAHDNLLQYLQFKLVKTNTKQLFAQVTTHSKLMSSSVHKTALSEASGIKAENILLLETLSSFDTEQQFCIKIQNHMQTAGDSSKLIIIQCDSGNENSNLIACARYSVMGEYEKLKEVLKEVCVHIVIVVQLPKVAGGCFSGFQCGKWQSVHIDDLCPDDYELPPLPELQCRSAGMLVERAVTETVEMETEETDLKNRGTFEIAEMEWEDNLTQQQVDIQEEKIPTGPGSDATQYDVVHLDDVVFDLKNTEIESRSGSSKHATRSSLDVKKLVLSCVHSALSKVKDKTENKHRETLRVDLVLKLFHQDTAEGRNSFLYGVCSLLAKILQSKESKSGTAHLIGNEAARLKNINKAGTFRRSCIKVLETKLSPILAGIIAFLDTNENLTLLQETQQQWQKDFWLTVLKTPNAVTLQYTDFQSPQKGTELEEVLVLTTGFEGRDFQLRMPFSWLLIDKINNILNLQRPVKDIYERKTSLRSESCFRVLRESPLCKIADQLNDSSIVTEAQSDYTFDLVHTMYPAESGIEYDLVCQAVRSASDLLQKERGSSSVLSMAINAHLAFELLAPRLNYFHLITTLWPDCCSAVEKVRSETLNHFLVTENDLTSCATFLLLESLTPEKNELDIQYSRSNWLKKTVQYRSVVEKVILFYDDLQNCHTDIPLPHQTIRRIKAQWSRIMVMKLFIEHVCVLEKDTRITIQYCSPLWKLLGEETDMKNKESLTAVEKFMKLCQMNAMKEYMGTILKCSDCEKMLEGIPITLPCKDILCDRCYSDLKATRRNMCTKCRQTFPDKWIPGQSIQPKVKDNTYNIAEEKLKDYQVRCNAFFMDMVSQLCFADSKAPSKDVIEQLLTYVFCETRAKFQKTKEFSVFSIGLDPNPVFRSFLLQLLMQTSEESVLNNLETFLNGIKSTISTSEDVAEEKLQYMEICTLVIQCIEDNLLLKLNKEDTDNRLKVARNALQNAQQTIETDGVSVEKLYGLARARVGLAEIANHVAQLMKKKSKTLPKHDLLEMAKKLCQDSRSEWPRKYLVKYICRYYGVDVYQAVSRSEDRYLHWITMDEANADEVAEVPDRYITSGEIYRQIRECIAKVLLGEAVTTIEDKMKDIERTTTKAEPMFHLAVHRKITCSFVLPQDRRRTHPKIISSIQDLVTACGLLKNKELIHALISNTLKPKQLIVAERQDLRHQGIQCLVVHFWIVMSKIKTDKNLLRPLRTLMKTPHLCENMFLPTMPQDDLEDVKEALIAARTTVQNADKQPTFYRCPNGHPYVIGDCGKPDQISKCQCGAEIGGQSHKLVDLNTADTAKDTTMTGHILGRAELRGSGPKPERSLTPAQCAVLRLFVHLAMFVGAGESPRDVQRIIKDNIEENEVDEYLWSHIELDLEDIHRAFARSLDDVLVFAHCIVAGLLNKCDEDQVLEGRVSVLSTKKERQDWECSFISRYVHEYLKNLDKLLETCNADLANDEGLGTSSLLRALYETATENAVEVADIQETPRVWRYRTPISLEHLRQTLEASADTKASAKQEYKVLRLFMREEHHLRALRYIPSILRLHRALFRKYQLKLDKAEALQITVERIKKDKVAGFDTENLLQDFSDAWELVREDLKCYVCPTENGGMTVPKEFCSQRIADDTPVAMLLPTSKGAGLCSYALLDFSMRKQNGFLDQYIKETGSRLSSMTVVSPKDVTSAHLINFDFQHDFLPLVMANCQYSFEIGQGTKIEYDFVAIERQLMDRFLFSKSRIDVKYILQIDMMIYRTEFTNASVFKQLAEKIPQENFNMAIKKHICQELKMLPDICESLYNLDIAISFLKSSSIDPNKNLHNFMKKTLLMEETLRSQTAQQICQLKHARSLWLMMALHKSKVMSDQQHKREYVFESVSSDFDENLEEGELSVLTAYTRNLSVEKLTRLIEVLHEFILLKVSEKQNTYDEDYTDRKHNRIKAWLLAYLEEDDNLYRDVAIFAEFPDELQYRHILHVWTEAYLMLKEKQMGHSGKF